MVNLRLKINKVKKQKLEKGGREGERLEKDRQVVIANK